jgi:hypothetical protein
VADCDGTSIVPPVSSEDEYDTEGQAFKWQIVDDPKSGRQLRAGWTPDEPQAGRPARSTTATKGKDSNSR